VNRSCLSSTAASDRRAGDSESRDVSGNSRLVGLPDMCFSAQSMCCKIAFVGHDLLAADFDGGLCTRRKFDEFSSAE